MIKLTEYSHGAGCGCKISPAILHDILKDSKHSFYDKKLLVGNEEKDDAAVLDIGNGMAVISTTDFFMPIVDDPFDFGRIAAANSISDIYAMGGDPALAISILGWPIQKLSPEIAKEVVEGARSVCKSIGISLAGGHSIDSPEPIFGLAVTGFIEIKNIKKNASAKAGDLIYLTKPLGVGIITTAKKKGLVEDSHLQSAIDLMLTLNTIGSSFGKDERVHALTDVTGFGLLGHLKEICEASQVSSVINFGEIPILPSVQQYIEKKCIPGGTDRNWKSYGEFIHGVDEFQRVILSDPQTSGGLLVIIDKEYKKEFESIYANQTMVLKCVGEIISESKNLITVHS